MANDFEITNVNGTGGPPWTGTINVPPNCTVSGTWPQAWDYPPWVQCVVPIAGTPYKTNAKQCNANGTWDTSFSGLPATSVASQLSATLYSDSGCTQPLSGNQGPLITVTSSTAEGSCGTATSKQSG